MRGAGASDRWSAGGYIRLGLFCILLLGGGLGGWAATAKLKSAVISTGRVEVQSRRQVVQHPDGGVVGQILVHEGDVVQAGEVLIRLDGTKLNSDLKVLESQLYELMARRGRLAAEQADRDSVTFDPELVAVASTDPQVQALMDGQRALFVARLKSLERETEVMRQRQAQFGEQIAGTRAQIDSLAQQRALIAEELDSQRKLLKRGLAQASRVLALEREAARLDGERGKLVAQTAQLKGHVSELEIEVLRLKTTRREDALTKLRDLGFRELELKQKRIALKEQLSRLAVRAPVGGVVLDMTVHALKAVVRPAEPILHIVPTDSALVVEAEVDPRHIDAVHAGQDAVLRFSAFNRRTTPVLLGTVTKVSPDALVDDRTKRAYYRAQVLLKQGELAKLEGQKLLAGMPVEVFIQTGARTPFEYLVKPITDFFHRAMREQ